MVVTRNSHCKSVIISGTIFYSWDYYNYIVKSTIISLYYKKISPPCQESRGRGGEGAEESPQGLIILSPPKAINFLVYSKFRFVRTLGLFEVWVCAKFGFVRLHRSGVLAGRGARGAPRSASIYIYIKIYMKEYINIFIHIYRNT